jgi:hypothetical protein
MVVYQCPDCLGVHGEATEPVVGLFVRCETCLLEVELAAEAFTGDAPSEPEFAPAQAA